MVSGKIVVFTEATSLPHYLDPPLVEEYLYLRRAAHRSISSESVRNRHLRMRAATNRELGSRLSEDAMCDVPDHGESCHWTSMGKLIYRK
jgi:hypothetical protein